MGAAGNPVSKRKRPFPPTRQGWQGLSRGRERYFIRSTAGSRRAERSGIFSPAKLCKTPENTEEKLCGCLLIL